MTESNAAMEEEVTGYHLFLEPEGVLHDELSEGIRSLAREYDGPVFPPHITLAGPFEGNEEEVIRTATAIAEGSVPLQLELADLGGEDTYFRAFYMHIEPSETLNALREKARMAYGLPNMPYVPHLSLYYGYPSDDVRNSMTASLPLLTDISFMVSAVSVYRTQGRADEWERIARILFSPVIH